MTRDRTHTEVFASRTTGAPSRPISFFSRCWPPMILAVAGAGSRFRLLLTNAPATILLLASAALVPLLASCRPSTNPTQTADAIGQELERLRAENREVKRLRGENQDLDRLRRENQEIQRLRGFDQEIARLRSENEQMRTALAKVPAALRPPPPEAPATNRPPPIENLPRAFEEAAFAVASQGPAKPEDTPQKGDNILIDQSVIGLLIPEFQDRTNGGPYEISGWLTSQGVVLTNYQQFNFLGITNYSIRRAPPKPQN